MSYYADDTVTVHHGDCLDVLATLPDASVDAVVTDPPYGLEFMGKEWDDLPPGRPWAEQCLRVLKPGGHLLAFGGTRTSHRLACAVEDAGFEIRDSIAWLYGSGFPKSLDVSKAIDKLDATDVRRSRNLAFTGWMRSIGVTSKQIDAATSSFMGGHYLTAREQAAVPTSDMFDMIRPLISVAVPEWVEALIRERTVESENFKAREVTGSKPSSLGGTVAAGERNAAFIEEHRGKVVPVTVPATDAARTWQGWGTALKPAHEPIVVARKPLSGTVAANVLTHGVGALNIDGCRVGEEGGTTGAFDGAQSSGVFAGNDGRIGGTPAGGVVGIAAGRWPANVVLDEDQAAALDQQSGESASPAPYVQSTQRHGEVYALGTLDDKAGKLSTHHGDSGGASRFFYTAKADAAERVRIDGTAHPTVKPLTLMRWLVRLVTPLGGIVLEPFAGSGTTVEACILEGFRCVAIEREADYLPLILQRIHRRRDPVAAVKATAVDGGLFDLLEEDEPA